MSGKIERVTRRGAVAGLAAGLAALGTGAAPAANAAPLACKPGTAEWAGVPCPKCHRPVWFLPRQRRNRCAWCQTEVVRRGVE